MLCLDATEYGAAAPASKLENETPVVEENVGGKTFSVSRAVVHASSGSGLASTQRLQRRTGSISDAKEVPGRGGPWHPKLVKHRVAPSGLVGQFEYTVEVKEYAPKSLEWHRVAGDFKEVDGYWRLEPLDGGRSTLVTYSSHVNGGMFMPQMLIKRQSRIDMPSVMSSLRHQAESLNNTIADRPHASRTQ